MEYDLGLRFEELGGLEIRGNRLAFSLVKKVVNKDDCDILALVAADIKSVIFYPVSEIKVVRKRCKAQDFVNETESLRYSIEKAKENK